MANGAFPRPSGAIDPMSGLETTAGVRVDQQMIDAGNAAASGSAFYGFGFALMVCALLVRIIAEYRKLLGGTKPEFFGAIGVIAVHVALLAAYPAFSSSVVVFAGSVGGGNINATAQIESSAQALSRRMAEFKAKHDADVARGKQVAAQARSDPFALDAFKQGAKDSVLAMVPSAAFFDLATTPPSVLVDALLQRIWEAITALCLVFAAAVLALLAVVQKIALAILIAAGPIVIALSAFPGPTSSFLFSWVLTVLEVSMWAFSSRVLTTMLNARFASGEGSVATAVDSLDASASYLENIVYCIMLAGGYMMIPVITAALFRGGGVSSIAGQSLGKAMGFATGLATGTAARAGGALSGLGGGGGGDAGPGPGGPSAGPGPGSADTSRGGDTPPSSSSSSDDRGRAIAKQRAIQKNIERAGD